MARLDSEDQIAYAYREPMIHVFTFISFTAATHDGSAPVQPVDANPLKRPHVVTLEAAAAVALPVKQKRKSPTKKAGNGPFVNDITQVGGGVVTLL